MIQGYDDDKSYIYPGQEKNVLLAYGADEASFYSFNEYDWESVCQNKNKIRRVNHIFYTMGLLKKAIELKDSSLANNLLALQYVKNGECYRPNHPHNDRQYYIDGLIELQKVNPKLEFYSGKYNLELVNSYFKQDNQLRKTINCLKA